MKRSAWFVFVLSVSAVAAQGQLSGSVASGTGTPQSTPAKGPCTDLAKLTLPEHQNQRSRRDQSRSLHPSRRRRTPRPRISRSTNSSLPSAESPQTVLLSRLRHQDRSLAPHHRLEWQVSRSGQRRIRRRDRSPRIGPCHLPGLRQRRHGYRPRSQRHRRKMGAWPS